MMYAKRSSSFSMMVSRIGSTTTSSYPGSPGIPRSSITTQSPMTTSWTYCWFKTRTKFSKKTGSTRQRGTTPKSIDPERSAAGRSRSRSASCQRPYPVDHRGAPVDFLQTPLHEDVFANIKIDEDVQDALFEDVAQQAAANNQQNPMQITDMPNNGSLKGTNCSQKQKRDV